MTIKSATDSGKEGYVLKNPLILSEAMEVESSFTMDNGEGNFNLSIDGPEVRYILLGSKMAELILDPNHNYTVDFSDQGVNRGVVINRVSISLTCSEADDANLVIEKFHRVYDQFLSEVFYDYAIQQTSNSGYRKLKMNDLAETGMASDGTELVEADDSLLSSQLSRLDSQVDSLVSTTTSFFAQEYMRQMLYQSHLQLGQTKEAPSQKSIAIANPNPQYLESLKWYYVPKLHKVFLGDRY
ncbi:MAG: hypothetical protein HRT74_03710, partial [Flavobacteriales bacterium]|nr:hypothetical protein [Flavobacteriales bacterium]